MDVLPNVSSDAGSLFHQRSINYLQVIKPFTDNTTETQAEAHEMIFCVVEGMNKYSSPSCTGIVGNVGP